MNSLNKLGLRVALFTILALAVIFGAWWGISHFFLKSGSLAQPTVEPDVSKDTDEDGLVDLVENLYKTDPSKADTDGDQVSDGEEVRLGRNPTLVDGVGTSGSLPIGSQVKEQNTWTQKYLASLPDDISQDQILDETRLSAFVEANKGQLLPTLSAGLVKTNSSSGKAAIQTYLDQISPVQNTKLHSISNQDIEAAWRLAYEHTQAETISTLITHLHENVTTLQNIEAPKELEALQAKVVAASHSLTNNTELLRDMNKDFVGGLIGAKNVEELASVFQEIESQVKELDTKYGF